MRLGITAFLTDLAMPPAELARAAEERGLLLALPPRAHPSPGAGRRRRRRWSRGSASTTTGAASTRFVALATAAAVTARIRLGTGVTLVAQHDPIVLAKQVATLDHLSGGRVVLGMGFGWNRAEAADHGVDVRAPAGTWPGSTCCACRRCGRRTQAEFHGEHVSLEPCLELAQAGPAAPGHHPGRRGGQPVGVRGRGRVRRRMDARRRRRPGRGPAPAPPGRGGARAATRAGSGWSPSAPCPPRPSWTTTAPWGRRGGAAGPVGQRRPDADRPRRPRRLPRTVRWRRWLS